MADSSPHPLRPYYVPREDAFVVPQVPSSAGSRYTSASPSRSTMAVVAPRPGGPSASASGPDLAPGSGSGSYAGSGMGPDSSSASASGFATRTGHAGLGTGSGWNRYISPSPSSDDDMMLPFPRRRVARGTPTGFVSAGQAMVYAAGMHYASTLVSMPFEVGKILLQIQWTPRPDVYARMERRRLVRQYRQDLAQIAASSSTSSHPPPRAGRADDQGFDEVFDSEPDFSDISKEETNEDEGIDQEASDSSSSVADSSKYFGDPTTSNIHNSRNPQRARPGTRQTQVKLRSSPSSVKGRNHSSSQKRRRSHRPSESVSVMPTVPTGGVWEMIKAVARGKEGVFGLFKGALTTFLLDISSSTLQPILYGVLSLFVSGSRAAVLPASELFTSGVDLPLSYAPRPWRALSVVFLSHVLTGVLISPLDLVRTRLVAQSLVPIGSSVPPSTVSPTSLDSSTHLKRRSWWGGRKYVWPWDALRTIREEEGGWEGVYLHPNLLIPTVLDYTFRPLIALATPLLIDQYLRAEPGTAPTRYALAELLVNTLGLCVTLPVETVRRRLQVQTRFRSQVSRPGPSTVSLHRGHHATDKKDHSRVTDRAPTRAQFHDLERSTSPVWAPGLGITPPQRLRTCVLTRPEPYLGVWDALSCIVGEESTPSPQSTPRSYVPEPQEIEEHPQQKHPHPLMSKQEDVHNKRVLAADDNEEVLAHWGYSSLGGLRNLYRGFSMGFGANLLVFLLTVVSGERRATVGAWTEM